MKTTLLHPTKHDGKRYKAGETVEMDRGAAKALIDVGVAEPFDQKAAKAAAANAGKDDAPGVDTCKDDASTT